MIRNKDFVMTTSSPTAQAKIVICMGSQSDWETMRHAKEILDALAIACETKIISAHRTPDRLSEFAKSAQSQGVEVIIAGAGGAAHLPGMIASHTALPVLGVPVESKTLKGMDSFYRLFRCQQVYLLPLWPLASLALKTRLFWQHKS